MSSGNFESLQSRQEVSDRRREEYFAEFKEELEGLNSKIEEVLDNVGMTIQEKLKETSSGKWTCPIKREQRFIKISDY